MSREEAIEIFKRLKENAPNEMHLETVGSAQELFDMAIQALSQEPCDVSVSEKEPNEITEEVTLRFFKNTLKVRWHDFVIYNVEWLKKHWQMEMDIVCGVKPCDDAISRKAVDKYIARLLSGYLYDGERERLEIFSAYLWELPSVTQKSGKWISLENRFELGDRVRCSNCGQVFVVGDDVSRHFCPNCGCRMVEPQESENKDL